MPWYIASLIIIFCATALSLAGLIIVRKNFKTDHLKSAHEVTGYTYGVIGVLYAVLLGFIVIMVHDRFHQAQEVSQREANYLASLYRDAEVFDPKIAVEIRTVIKGYIELVLKEEWDMMSRNELSLPTVDRVKQLWHIYYRIYPKDTREEVWLSEMIVNLNGFNSARLDRIFLGTVTLGPMFWTLLIIGALTTIFYLFFFHMESIFLHIFLTATVTGVIAFLLFLIYSFDSTYVGDVSVKPDALRDLYQFLSHWD